mgnify:CR=1 FL=1
MPGHECYKGGRVPLWGIISLAGGQSPTGLFYGDKAEVFGNQK